MKQIPLFLLSFFCLQLHAQNDEEELERRLYNLPNVQFKKITTANKGHLQYLLTIKQPLDHKDSAKGFFYQLALLTHKGFGKPMVMETEGYELNHGRHELEKILDANHVDIEHRYFGKSKPDSLQWDYLTFEQVTADLHNINTLLRSIYTGKWISTGISRGGQVAIYYKRFYPVDVDLTIPYVAPLPNALEDKRIYHFLDTVGSEDCRAKIFAVQKFLLEHEKEAIEKLKWYAKGKTYTFRHFGSIGKAFEMGILEYPFAFWQIGDVPCEKIPTNKSVDDYLDHVLAIGGFDFLTDKSITEWAANGYMAQTQMGFYGYDLRRYRSLLRYVKGDNPSAAFVPDFIPRKSFDSSFTRSISRWLDEQGNNILYIYGSRDTWSACQVLVSPQTNAKSFIIPGANHYQARIRNMPAELQRDFFSTMEKILGIQINTATRK